MIFLSFRLSFWLFPFVKEISFVHERSLAISSQHRIMFCMYINVGCDEEFMIYIRFGKPTVLYARNDEHIIPAVSLIYGWMNG